MTSLIILLSTQNLSLNVIRDWGTYVLTQNKDPQEAGTCVKIVTGVPPGHPRRAYVKSPIGDGTYVL